MRSRSRSMRRPRRSPSSSPPPRHLARKRHPVQPLKAAPMVVAGSGLGRVGAAAGGLASHMRFQIQPAGTNAPYIDPKVVLDGWKLLEATAVYRASDQDPFFGP